MPDHRFAVEPNKMRAQTGPTMRGNNDQINFSLFRHAHNLRRRFTMNDKFLNVKSRTFVAFGEFRQFALG